MPGTVISTLDIYYQLLVSLSTEPSSLMDRESEGGTAEWMEDCEPGEMRGSA